MKKKETRRVRLLNHAGSWMLLIAMLAASFSSLAQEKKHSQRLTENWKFIKSNLGGIWEAVRESEPDRPTAVPLWEEVSLPHCFNAEDAVDPDVNYYQGPGWYKTHLDVKNPYENGRTILHFEGAGQKTEVYVYMTKVGSHVGGYDEWSVDITEAVNEFLNDSVSDNFDGKIPISIRCDNSRDLEMIPSDLSDFTIYGGLYRYVNLVYLPPVFIDKFHVDVSYDPEKKEGEIAVNTSFKNYNHETQVPLSLILRDPNGEVVEKVELQVAASETYRNIYHFKIKDPEPWSPVNPNLYSIEAELHGRCGPHVVNENIGFRNFEFKQKGPFFLNGERLLLRGTHRHEDHAGLGAAMTEDLVRREMIMIKEMGANFIRLGHYQQSGIVLDLCDSLGILVWEEIPWCRGGLGSENYKNMARQMLASMIDQHRNHPSIIIWGLGNENDWPGDFPEFSENEIREFMSELNELAHRLDDSRKTAIRRCEFCKDIVDVYSPSIWAGWYHGKFTDYRQVSEKNTNGVNHFFHAEWGASHHAGRHSEAMERKLDQADMAIGDKKKEADAVEPRVVRDSDWSVTYAVNLIDWHLKEQEKMPWLTGAAYWAFKDFSTPVRPENPVPYINQKGVVERDFIKKESYYVFQSYWADKPMAHIYGHTWPVRWGAAGEKKMVRVYSNCDKAELFVNGKSMGMKKRNSQDYPAAGLRWEVALAEGKNDVRVEAYKGKEKVTDALTWLYQTQTWKDPAKLSLSVQKIGENEQQVQVNVLDASGIPCLDAKNWIRFELVGDGRLKDNLGTATGSKKVQLRNGRASIKISEVTGKCVLAVKCEGLETEFIEINDPKK